MSLQPGFGQQQSPYLKQSVNGSLSVGLEVRCTIMVYTAAQRHLNFHWYEIYQRAATVEYLADQRDNGHTMSGIRQVQNSVEQWRSVHGWRDTRGSGERGA